MRASHHIASILGFLLLAAAAPVWGQTLEEAKTRGLVGEQANGYIGIVSPPGSPDLRDLVESVNLRRRDEYERIAARNGLPLEHVEQLAGKRAIERSPPGHWVRPPDSRWRQL